jgi:hypothetical protein
MDNRTAVLANYTGVEWFKVQLQALPRSSSSLVNGAEKLLGKVRPFCHRTKGYRANATSIFWDVQDHVTSKYLLVYKHIYW